MVPWQLRLLNSVLKVYGRMMDDGKYIADPWCLSVDATVCMAKLLMWQNLLQKKLKYSTF